MKTKSNINRLALKLLIAFVALTISSELFAQDKTPTALKDFTIVIEMTDTGIKMQGIEGSAWTDLSFGINNDRPQAVDEYGMTELNKVSSQKDPNLADFLFTITKNETGITLKGIEGTAWTDLSFSLKNYGQKAINQYGMTTHH